MLSGIPAHTFWRTTRKIRALNTSDVTDVRPGGLTASGTVDDAQNTTITAAAPTTPPAKRLPYEEDPSLKKLNGALLALASVFPDISPECLREMLSTFSEESRLEIVTDKLIKEKAEWVRGRWRIPKDHGAGPGYKYRTTHALSDGIPTSERFRSSEYKAAVKSAFYQEFKGLSHPTIKAVLAEFNYSYTNARPTLIALYTKSWRFSISNLFARRKAPSVNDHPLLLWQINHAGESEPTLRVTSSAELNDEIHDTLIAPLLAKRAEDQLQRDKDLAEQLNDAEAEQESATFDCECCFIPNSFERITTCDASGHYLCFRCLRNTMKEVLYGQGWSKSVDIERCSLKCIALVAGSGGECGGCIPQDQLRAALELDTTGLETWRKFEERAAQENIAHSQMLVAKCLNCSYAEVDELRDSAGLVKSYKLWLPLFLFTAYVFTWTLTSNAVAVQTITLLAAVAVVQFSDVRLQLQSVVTSFQQSNLQVEHGQRFICRNPSCGHVSCLSCSASWRDIHVCYESEQQALRSYVESAMANAVKRTCPKCNLSFVKDSGCNKLTCVCGYAMCYICRNEIGKENYAHFCPHFRIQPGAPCTECDRCDLYRTEDEDAAIEQAKKTAEAEWWQKHSRKRSSKSVIQGV